jgi:predicted MFS family arabinose efflux permease
VVEDAEFTYARLMTVVLILLSLALLGFSVLVLISGSALAVPGTLAVLALWGVAGFALVPLQQYRVVQLAPRTRNVALSLNASAIYLGQGTGAGLGAPPHQQEEETGCGPKGLKA